MSKPCILLPPTILALAMLAAPWAARGAAPAPPSAPAAAPAVPSALERREIMDWLNKFRRARGDPAARAQAVARILEIGPDAAAQLLASVSKELAPLHAKYRAAFLEATMVVLRARFETQDPTEVDSLRETVLALSKDGDLTHEKIVANGDPAMARLGELLMVDPGTVLKDTPLLRAQRDALLELGTYWQRATDALAEHAAKAAGEPAEKPPPPARFEDVLKDQVAISSLLALARNDSQRKILLVNADLAAKLPLEEARGILDLNRMRLLLGLKPLRIDPGLCDAARDHAKDMVTLRFFAHDSPVPGKASPWDRAKRFGTSAGAENIAGGCATGVGANRMWFHSPGHHKNMLGGHSRMGLGKHENTWVQMFG